MSEPKLISPLLDGFIMGSPMTSRLGIQCCPAMIQESGKKYIVKVISIPASAVQLEALLLTGAFASEQAALGYFKEQAEDLVGQAQILKRLSSLEGFLPYEAWQIVDNEDAPGFQVYLLGAYRHSLDQSFRRHNMTHLNAVNLGLDLCAALAVCRRAGYLYVDLKPQNIYISDDGEYRIGDLGFVALDSLRYTSLDERYHSAYTAPEATDILNTLNDTVDIYAVGTILYQAYNDGVLPTSDANGSIPAPQYADYEMAEIILKAMDPQPENRWKTPMEMGHALVEYMQKNGANNVPIVPLVTEAPAVVQEHIAEDSPEEASPEEEAPAAEPELSSQPEPIAISEAAPDEFASQEAAAAPLPQAEDILADDPEPEADPHSAVSYDDDEILSLLLADSDDISFDLLEMDDLQAYLPGFENPEIPQPVEQSPIPEEIPEMAPASLATEEAAEPIADPSLEAGEALEDPQQEILAQFLEASSQETDLSHVPDDISDDDFLADIPGLLELIGEIEAEADNSRNGFADLAGAGTEEPPAFMQYPNTDETLLSAEMAADVDYDEISDDTSNMLSQADALLAHETPAGVVAPEPIEVPLPPPIVFKNPAADLQVGEFDASLVPPSLSTSVGLAQEESADSGDEDDYYDDDYFDDAPESSFPVKKLVIGIVILALLAGLCLGGYYYYKEYYLQTITSMKVTGSETALSVQLVSDIEEGLLTAVCTDTYGTRRTAPIVNGAASFGDLSSDMIYNVSIQISGFHKLVGPTVGSYTTPKETKIISFTAIAGTEEGSADLRFKVDGQSGQSWRVVYSAEGEPEKTQEFTDSVVTITGLTVGKTYTFQLKSDSNLYIVGNDTLQYTALSLIKAQNLQITSCSGGSLTAKWEAPQGSTVNSWTVRCYNEAGFDQAITTVETFAEFTGLDCAQAYTVEVIAENMTAAVREYVKANSITITSTSTNTSDPTQLILSWEYEGPTPEGEWLVLYTIDGSEPQEVARTTTNSVTIPNMIPGATYSFTIQTASGVTMFAGEFDVTVPKASAFSSYSVASSDFRFVMCETPDKADWEHKDAKNNTTTFKPGQKASFKVTLSKEGKSSSDEITLLFVIRDSEGKLVSKNITQRKWDDMWYLRMCSLDVPAIPAESGSYTMEIYFNGYSVHSQNFSIAQ